MILRWRCLHLKMWRRHLLDQHLYDSFYLQLNQHLALLLLQSLMIFPLPHHSDHGVGSCQACQIPPVSANEVMVLRYITKGEGGQFDWKILFLIPSSANFELSFPDNYFANCHSWQPFYKLWFVLDNICHFVSLFAKSGPILIFETEGALGRPMTLMTVLIPSHLYNQINLVGLRSHLKIPNEIREAVKNYLADFVR